MELVSKLKARKENGNPITVGVIGCGQMGSGFVHTVSSITGMNVSAIADIDPEKGIRTFEEIGYKKDDIVVTDTVNKAQAAIEKGKVVVSQDSLLFTKIPSLEANVEATGVTAIGAENAYYSIMNKKPIIMLNAETDVTVGAYLNFLARNMNSLYTVASGDEPGVLKMLYEQATLMGFDVVTLGKGKNNVIDFGATIDTCMEEARSKDMNPKMLAAFKDGTKTMVEMAAVSNATGLLPDVPGMHGPKVELEDLSKVFIPETDGGIFGGKGRVDFSTGKIAPGVFAIVYTEEKRMMKEMKFITREDGPYYLHFRPYHLCDLETPQSIAEAVLLNEVTVTAERPYSEVVCKAKRDINPGEILEDMGGKDWHGHIMTYAEAKEQRKVPMGIASKAKVVKTIRKGEVMRYDQLDLNSDSFVYKLRQMQDSIFK